MIAVSACRCRACRDRPHPPAPSRAAAGEGEKLIWGNQVPPKTPNCRGAAASRRIPTLVRRRERRRNSLRGGPSPLPNPPLPRRGRFPTDTSPCQTAAGEGEPFARGRAEPSPGSITLPSRRGLTGDSTCWEAAAPANALPARPDERFREEAAAPRQPRGAGRAWLSPEPCSLLSHRKLTGEVSAGAGLRWKAATPRQSGGPGGLALPRCSCSPSPAAAADWGRYPSGSGRAAATRGVRGRAWPSPEPATPPLPPPRERGLGGEGGPGGPGREARWP